MFGYVTIVEVGAAGGYRWQFTVRGEGGAESIIAEGFETERKAAARAAYRFAFEWECRRV